MSNTIINVDVSKLLNPLKLTAESINFLSNNLNEVQTMLSSISTNTKELKDCLIHIHNSHLHNSPHLCSDKFEAKPGSPLLDSSLSLSDLLIREFQHNVDCDGNGLIYGKDFVIIPNDKNAPPQINELLEIIDFNYNQISWDSYKQTLPDYLK